MMTKTLLVFTALFLLGHCTAQAQVWHWATKAGGIENDHSNGLDVDSTGSSYLTGTFYDSAAFGSTTLVSAGEWSVYIVKYDVNGNVVWARIAAQGSAVSASGICVDEGGNISIVGGYSGRLAFGTASADTLSSEGSFDVYVSRFTNTGDFVWAASLGGDGIDYAGGISRDNNGNVYLTGDFHISSFPYSSSKIFIAKYDSQGNNAWLKTEINNGNSHFGIGIKTDASGNSYVTGDFFNTIKFTVSDSIDAGNVESNVFVAKFDSDGEFLWGRHAGAASGYCVSKAIDIDATGNAYIAGAYRGTIAFDSLHTTGTSGLASEVFIVKCDAAGNFVWVSRSIGPGIPSTISVNGIENVVVTGNFSTTIDFGTRSLTSVGNNDIFISALDLSGIFTWATSCGGRQNDVMSGAAKTHAHSLYFSGTFIDTMHFGSSFSLPAISNVKSDVFIAKLSTGTVAGIDEQPRNDQFIVYPNPTSGSFTILQSDDNAEIVVTDILGLMTEKIHTSQKSTTLRLAYSGVYIVAVTTKHGTTTQVLVVN